MRRRFVIAIMCSVAVAQTQTSGTAKKPSTKTGASKAGAQKAAPKKPAAPAAPAKNPTAVIHTTEGDLACELYKDKVPNAVDNFVGLATGAKDRSEEHTSDLQPR